MRGFTALGLVRPKNPSNIGSVLRAAGCYGADMVAVAGARGHGALQHIPTDTMKAWKHIPTLCVDDVFDVHPVGAIPVAVELVDRARDLVTFSHPERAFYIFGPEDGTLGKVILDRCPHVVRINTAFCMNLAATANVVLYDRMSKRSAKLAEVA